MALNQNYYPVVTKVNYDEFTVESIKSQALSKDDEKLILNYPTVYIINDKSTGKTPKFMVYVGETTDITRRTKQHLTADIRNGRDDFKQLSDSTTSEMYIIGHKYFNKSLTLDIENKLFHYLSSVEAVSKVNNRRGNPQNDYYTSKVMDGIFSKLWRKLHKKNPVLFPAESIIRDSALFKASPFHKLTNEQIEAKKQIMLATLSTLSQELDGQLIMVEGEAGAGKTVLMSNLLYDIFNSDDFPVDPDKISVHLLVNHDQQLIVYEQLANKLGLQNKNGQKVIDKPTSFINRMNKGDEKADIVIVDEAHLLLTRGTQYYQGKNHLKDLLANAKVVVAVFDEHQILSAEQFWEVDQIGELRTHATEHITLKNQMRIQSESTSKWIRSLIDDDTILPFPVDKHYDFKVFSSPTEMYEAIQEKAQSQENGISRITATYDWPFVLKKSPEGKPYWTVDINDFSMPWNLQLPNDRKHKSLSWAEQPQTINEIGSTFTIQGFDLNYAAVIIGPSVTYRNGKIVYDPSKSFNKKATQRRTLSDGSKVEVSEQLLRNELNVLLTRGVNGLYLFAVDKALQEALMKAAKNS